MHTSMHTDLLHTCVHITHTYHQLELVTFLDREQLLTAALAFSINIQCTLFMIQGVYGHNIRELDT